MKIRSFALACLSVVLGLTTWLCVIAVAGFSAGLFVRGCNAAITLAK